MCVESAEFDFSHNYITVFYGSNGSGKSTIFEAIALCWTERRRGDSFKDFIKHGADSAEIHLTATVRGEPIRFDIEIKDKKGSTPFQRKITYKGGEYNNSECTALLNSFDIDYLQHIMFSMQGENNITDLKPGERTKLLKRIFNFEFESQLQQLDKLIEQEEQNLLTLRTRQDVMSHLKFEYEEEEKPLSAAERKKIETRIAAIDETVRAQEQNQLLEAETSRRVESLRNQCAAAQSRKHTLDLDIEDLSSSKIRLEGDQKRHNQALANLSDPTTIEADIQAKLSAIETLTQLVTQSRTLLKEKEQSLNTQQSTILELRNHIEAHREGRCPKCGQTTQPDSVPALEAKLQAVTAEREALSLSKTQIEATERNAERDIARYNAEIPALREKIKSTAEMKVQYENILKTVVESIRQTEITLQSRKSTVREVEVQIKELEQQISEISPKLTRKISLENLKAEKESWLRQLQEDHATIARNEVIRRKNEEMRKKEEDNKHQLAELNRQQNAIILSTNNYREAKHILEVDLPNFIIVKACSKLERHINHFISEVKPGMVVRLFQARSGVEFYYSPTGEVANSDDWTSTKMASGFERELLSTAWRVALARAYNLSALMLDEVDSAANTFSSEKMFREVANLVGFEQLFIVSHKPEVVDTLLQENDRVTAYYVSEGTFTRQEY